MEWENILLLLVEMCSEILHLSVVLSDITREKVFVYVEIWYRWRYRVLQMCFSICSARVEMLWVNN